MCKNNSRTNPTFFIEKSSYIADCKVSMVWLPQLFGPLKFCKHMPWSAFPLLCYYSPLKRNGQIQHHIVLVSSISVTMIPKAIQRHANQSQFVIIEYGVTIIFCTVRVKFDLRKEVLKFRILKSRKYRILNNLAASEQ